MTDQLVPSRLASALPGWTQPAAATAEPVVGVLTGEGVGPEVLEAALAVLDAVGRRFDTSFDVRHGGEIGLDAQARHGCVLPDEVVSFCGSVFATGGAVLCGPAGGRFVYDLRARFDLFCKFTPLRPYPPLANVGRLRAEAVRDVDIMMIRDNVGGMYFARETVESDAWGMASVTSEFVYERSHVERLVAVAVDVARSRRGRLALVVKPGGVHAVSRLWAETFEAMTGGSGLTSAVLGVDHAVYQLISAAPDLDVLVSPNMLGDVIADCGGVLLGSRAMTYSGNFGPDRTAVYQTGHGAAYDLAGGGRANPLGQIASVAFMLRESFGMVAAAAAIDGAVEHTLAAGWRTPDIAEPGCRLVGTAEMGEQVARAIAEQPDGATAVA
ncbi:MAG: isocitrate/isopropylmalate family dehydrogenase [Actinomycetota bacterium]|nr:isocitrate/isopropylmalate family dehydrogenase [Actinomycetota bacterium]